MGKIFLGFGFMVSFVVVSVWMSAIFYDAVDWGKALVAGGAILCPVLSISTTYGLMSIVGVRTNSYMLVMPFLIMGIGVFFAVIFIVAQKEEAPLCFNFSLLDKE